MKRPKLIDFMFIYIFALGLSLQNLLKRKPSPHSQRLARFIQILRGNELCFNNERISIINLKKSLMRKKNN